MGSIVEEVVKVLQMLQSAFAYYNVMILHSGKNFKFIQKIIMVR